jgi:hypothetical protein
MECNVSRLAKRAARSRAASPAAESARSPASFFRFTEPQPRRRTALDGRTIALVDIKGMEFAMSLLAPFASILACPVSG